MDDNIINPNDPYEDDFLAHVGVKGMKWGVRKGALSGANAVRKRYQTSKKRVSKIKKATNTKAKRASLKKDFKNIGTQIKLGAKAQRAEDKAARAKDVAAFKKAAQPKSLNALITISGTSVGGTHKHIGGVSQESMRAKGQDNVAGYVKLIGKQAVAGVAVVAIGAALDVF